MSFDKNGAKFYIRKPFLKQVNSTFHAYKQLILFFFFCFITILILVVAVSNGSFAQKTRLFLMEVLHPIAKISSAPSKGINGAREKAGDWIFAYERLQSLKKENQSLREKESYFRSVENENEELKRILRVSKSQHQKLKTVPVISYPGKPFVKSILLGAGLHQKIEPQRPIIVAEGLVGRTIESSNSLTRALLITDLNSRIPVIIKPSNRHAILVGDNSNKPLLKYLPYDIPLKEGDVVKTSGRGGLFPSGIPIGTIESISKDEAQVKPYANLQSLSFVNILTHELGDFSSKFK